MAIHSIAKFMWLKNNHTAVQSSPNTNSMGKAFKAIKDVSGHNISKRIPHLLAPQALYYKKPFPIGL